MIEITAPQLLQHTFDLQLSAFKTMFWLYC